MAKMGAKTNGGTKMKKDVEALKAAASEMLGQTKGKKYGAEAMPANGYKKKLSSDAMKQTPGAISEGEKQYAKKKKKKGM